MQFEDQPERFYVAATEADLTQLMRVFSLLIKMNSLRVNAGMLHPFTFERYADGLAKKL